MTETQPLCVVIFGATGTIGAGALLECLDSPAVGQVRCVVRRPTGRTHPKLREIVHGDLADAAPLADALSGIDACFWCVGIPSSGVTEAHYTEVTHDYTLAVANVLLERSPQACFVFVSGEGTDETEKSSSMWARVKGRTENEVLALGFRDAVAFRPGMIRPRRGLRHGVALYRWTTWVLWPLFPLLRALKMATSTVEIGRAMVAAALGKTVGDPPKRRLDSADINALAKLV